MAQVAGKSRPRPLENKEIRINISTLLHAETAKLIASEHDAVAKHPLFKDIKTIHELRIFMEWHVFAVWDFMSLVKRLQHEFAPISFPWLPPKDPRAARLINEINLAEESDEGLGGHPHASHFDIYLSAMEEIGASTAPMKGLLDSVSSGVDVREALAAADVPSPIKTFVNSTLDAACNGSTPEVLGSFIFGRETLIPAMFESLLESWKIDRLSVPRLAYYIDRHVQIDGNEHGPAALSLIELIAPTPSMRDDLFLAGLTAVKARREFWNALHRHVRTPNPQKYSII